MEDEPGAVAEHAPEEVVRHEVRLHLYGRPPGRAAGEVGRGVAEQLGTDAGVDAVRDATYDQARQLDQIQFDTVLPSAVAYCESPADVALCLRFAADNDLATAVRSGGLSAAGYSTCRGLVVDVSRLDSIAVGSGSGTLGPGAQMVDITHTLGSTGLAVAGGYCPTVRAGGFLQGGGLGPRTRTIGMACDTVTSARVVLADGRCVTASATDHPDLYWALRGGGGGNFGVVTSYTLTTAPVAEIAVAFINWPYDQAVDVMNGWAQWLAGAPSAVGGLAEVNLTDPSATPQVQVILLGLGGLDRLNQEATRLADAVGSASASQFAAGMPYESALMIAYGCSSYAVAQCHRTGTDAQLPRTAWTDARSRLFTGPLPRSNWSELLTAYDTDRRSGRLRQLRATALGGAANAMRRTDTAHVHRDSLYLLTYNASIAVGPTDDDSLTAARDWADRGFRAMDPYSNGESYQNCIDPALSDYMAAYYAENANRLVRVKKKYDPDGLFRFPQAVAP
ncbi:FAD-binding protein [Streptomyces sp. NPDC050549]|uniref:FAD-binding oxidoreductase n=1 Tax=Streptomyces sp. NPDC050549 TaxID=3155406 RepID=UPI00344A58A3